MSTIKKRFIAGALCPRCKTPDRIVMYRIDEKEFRECVECGFKDEMHFKPQQRELETRVNVTEEKKKEEIQMVKILDFPKNKD